MAHINNGVIVLMHAGSQVESETLDELMTKIEQMNYQMVTVTEVLQPDLGHLSAVVVVVGR